MKKNLDAILSGLFFFFWFACLTSQSLMDLADTLMFIAGATLLYRKAKAAKNWKMLWPKTTGLSWLWLSWFTIVAVGLFYNNSVNRNTLEAWLEFRWMFIFQVLCFTLSWIEWSQRKINILNAILLTMVLVSFGLFYYNYDRDFRAGGTFEHSMPFAHTYGPAFIFVAGILLVSFQKQIQSRWLGIATVFSAAVIVTLSLTRGVWLGMFAGALSISLFKSRRYGLILTCLLTLTFGLTFAFSPAARERATTTNGNESDNLRKALWLGNLEIVKDYPIFGTGYSQNKYYLPDYYEKLGFPRTQFASHAHNEYLHLWAGTGTFGLIFYLIFLISVLRMTVIAFLRLGLDQLWPKALAMGSLGAQICFDVGAFTESNFSIAKNRYMYLLISAIGVSIYYRYVTVKDFKTYQIAEKDA
jgi:O-antigen ligase